MTLFWNGRVLVVRGPCGLPSLSIAHYGEQSGDLMRDTTRRESSSLIDFSGRKQLAVRNHFDLRTATFY
jgi:hypothetical protein